MKKIIYRLVFNRKRHLNVQGKALLQVEASLGKKKVYFSTHIYLKPEQWDNKKKIIKNHPHAIELNYMILEFIIHLEQQPYRSYWGIATSPPLRSIVKYGKHYGKGLDELSVECWYISFGTIVVFLRHIL